MKAAFEKTASRSDKTSEFNRKIARDQSKRVVFYKRMNFSYERFSFSSNTEIMKIWIALISSVYFIAVVAGTLKKFKLLFFLSIVFDSMK